MPFFFWLGMSLMGLAALAALVIPLRQQPRLSALVLVLASGFSAWAYWHWGAYVDWQNYASQQQRELQVKALLKEMKGPDELIRRFKAKLEADQDNPKAWYLLGKLQAAQGDWSAAAESLARATSLAPEAEEYWVHYAHARWQEEGQQFSPAVHEIFIHLLRLNAKQPDALAMLAMEAFQAHDYAKAIDYWQQLLVLAPEDSAEAKAIRQAIAKARAKEQAIREE